MPILEIDGVGRVEVGPEFLKLPRDQQNAAVQEITLSAKQSAISVRPTPQGQPGYAEDMAKGGASGVARGLTAIAGMGGDISDAAAKATDAMEKAGLSVDRKAMLESMPGWLRTAHDKPAASYGTQAIRGAVDRAAGLPVTSYEPQTLPGKGARTVGEFVPGALMGPGGVGRNLVNFALAPGIASEAAGQATAGTPYETPARIGAAVVTGGGAAVLNRPRTVDRALRGSMSPDVNPQAINAAGQLMDDAAARGVTLTWAEALEQVAPGAGLTNMQRVIESTAGGREVLAPVMAQRPAQVENAARQVFDTVAPRNPVPSGIGPAVGQAAESTANDVRGAINAVARPFYDAAATQRVGPAEMGRVRMAPGWAEARDAVRNDPQLNRYVAQLPENSVGFLDAVKKFLDNAAENAASPVNQQRSMARSSGYGIDAGTVRNAAVNASPNNYGAALAIEATGRERFLQPLLDGPLGKIAARDTTTRNAMEALFPSNPLPNSEREITRAVGALAARNQGATRDLIRAHAEATFNDAAKNLQGGANQWGGANFAKAIAGNQQQRANLEAAVRASGRDGDQVWTGFNRLLDVVEATGTRQHVGSKTAFNAQELKDLSTGSMIGNAAKTGASPGKWINVISDAWSRWQLGNNVEQLAHILVDQRSRNLLRAIASRPTGGRENAILAGQLILGAQQAAHSK